MQKYYHYITILLSAILISISSIAAHAEQSRMNTPELNTQAISLQIEKLTQDVSKTNLNYEQLTQIFSIVNALQPQVNRCIQSSQARLKKIQEVLNSIELSKAIKPDTPSYTYLMDEKNDQLTRITYCDLFNYRLSEIHDLATNKIDHVSKSNLLKRTPFWQEFNPDMLSHISIGSKGIYQQLISSSSTILSKAIIIYLLIILFIKMGLNDRFNGNPWPYAMTIFQSALFFVPTAYVIFIQLLEKKYNAIPLHLVNYYPAIYIIVLIRLAIAMQEHGKQWLSKSIASMIQQRITLIATIMLLIYILYRLLNTQLIPVQYLLFLETVLISSLNLAYVGLIWAILDAEYVMQHVTAFNLKTIKTTLKTICLLSIVLAWSGYLYLAFLLIPNMVLTLTLMMILFEFNRFIAKCYFMLSNASQTASKKLRFILGIKTDKTLIELYIIRISVIIPAVGMSVLCLFTLWGATRFQITNIFLNLQHGITLFGTTFQPTNIIRAINIFCYIILSGRALAAYIVRHKLAAEEIHTRNMMISLIHYLSFAFAFVFALYIMHVDLKGIMVISGALSVGLGFGLQNFAKDFISALVIMINKSIQIGDHVVIADKGVEYDGFVKKIGALSTQLHTLSYSDVFIPNSYIISQLITNFTFHNNRLSRVNIKIEVDKEQNIERIKQLLLDIATKNPDIMQEPPNQPLVLFELGEVNLWCVVNDVNKKETIMSALNFAINNAMKTLDKQPYDAL